MNHLILETKSQLKDFYPDIRELDVRTERAPDGSFIARIHARARGKIFHAVKKDPSYRRCIDKCQRAIESQIQKMRDRKVKIRHRISNHVLFSA